MSPIETDIFFDRGCLKKADSLQMFWLFAVAVGVPVLAVAVAVAVAVPATFAALL